MRTEVEKFAEAMERELQKNEYRGGWQQEDLRDLLLGIYRNAGELDNELSGEQDPDKILKAAADIGNYAMMLADLYEESDAEEGVAKGGI